VLIGNEAEVSGEEKLLVLETNVDDMSGKVCGYIMERAFEKGALDCYFTPIHMKKNRPAVLLTVLCRLEDREKFMQLLFEETTTLGIRSYEVDRRALERHTVRVETEYGPIDVKVARLADKVVNAMPEYEECRSAARAAGVPLRMVEDAARSAFANLNAD
jgi:uncharacterized protein (DUF111 family)